MTLILTAPEAWKTLAEKFVSDSGRLGTKLSAIKWNTARSRKRKSGEEILVGDHVWAGISAAVVISTDGPTPFEMGYSRTVWPTPTVLCDIAGVNYRYPTHLIKKRKILELVK